MKILATSALLGLIAGCDSRSPALVGHPPRRAIQMIDGCYAITQLLF